MRLSLGVLLFAIGIGVFGASAADEPATAPAVNTPAAPAPDKPAAREAPAPAAALAATPASPATSAAATTAPAGVNRADSSEQKEKHLLAEGYKSEMRNGDKVFCRKEEVLGSRLGGQKVCGNADNLVAREQMDKENAERTERQGRSGFGPCAGCKP